MNRKQLIAKLIDQLTPLLTPGDLTDTAVKLCKTPTEVLQQMYDENVIGQCEKKAKQLFKNREQRPTELDLFDHSPFPG